MPPVSVCHPPGIDDDDIAPADDAVVPIPRLRDLLARRQSREGEGSERSWALGRQIALSELARESRWGMCGENADTILLDDAPPAVELREIGSAFVHHAGRAGGEWSIDDVAVAGDPADIGRAPIGVFFLEIEDPFHGGGDVREIAAGGVQNPFGLASRP